MMRVWLGSHVHSKAKIQKFGTIYQATDELLSVYGFLVATEVSQQVEGSLVTSG
jgi:hypothetical protein